VFQEMHWDGFRFDLASIFSRNKFGRAMLNPRCLGDRFRPVCRHKVDCPKRGIPASIWVGSFGKDKWKEWNGQFRDDVRSFVKGDRNRRESFRERYSR